MEGKQKIGYETHEGHEGRTNDGASIPNTLFRRNESC